MPRIVAVHGIAQEYKGSHTLADGWLPALRDGLDRAGASLTDDGDFVCAFYGDLFRPAGKAGAAVHTAQAVTEDWETEMLALWWAEAAATDRVARPGETGKARTPRFVQAALAALSSSKFFAGLGERALIGALKQVRGYLSDEAVRRAARARVEAEVQEDTRVVIGHSLGSVVAYEVLCAHPEWRLDTFVTLGSPLAIANLIFHRLDPAPDGELGVWPGTVERWVNVADGGDVVALEKQLARRFGPKVEDHLIHNGATAHDVTRYLTAGETGTAIARGLDAP